MDNNAQILCENKKIFVFCRKNVIFITYIYSAQSRNISEGFQMDFTFLQHDGFPGLDQPVFYEAATDFTASAGAYPLIACTEQFSMQIFLKT